MRKPPFGGTASSVTGKIRQPLPTMEASSRPPAPPLADLPLAALRCVWWSHRRHGHTLPAEPGIIVLDGGRDG